MKKLAMMLLVVAGVLGLGGCATPAYSGGENVARTLRTWDYEFKQMNEDLMYEAMFYPTSRLTPWNLR
jgi:hypothetical protein